MTLIPAYGRDYKSELEVSEDFLADKDFIIQGINNEGSFRDHGRYANRQDLIGQQVQIRFNNLQDVVGFTVT